MASLKKQNRVEPVHPGLAPFIQHTRIALGMDQGEFAALLGFRSPSVVSNWETGSGEPRASTLLRIAAVSPIGFNISNTGEVSTNDPAKHDPGEARRRAFIAKQRKYQRRYRRVLKRMPVVDNKVVV